MKKRYLVWAMLLCLLLSGCGGSVNPKATQKTDATVVLPTEAATEATTEATTEVTTEATTEVTTEATTEVTTEVTTEPTTAPTTTPTTAPTAPPTTQAPSVYYYVTISNPTYPIYSGPGPFYSYVGTVHVSGVYTIVDESWDGYGSLWGKLKSGVGWINLTELYGSYSPPVSNTPYYKSIYAGCEIYSGPGYGYSYVGTVSVNGTYTIVEEFWDSYGNLWGRLKSGVGWVNLSYL